MRSTITYDWRDGSIEHREVEDHENGTPFWLYHGLGIEFRVPERDYDSESLVEEFRAEFGEELDALREGFDEVWDGHNRVGSWPEQSVEERESHDEQIQALSYAVEQWEPRCGLEVWDASDYYHGALTFAQIVVELKITAVTTDAELDAIADDAQDAAVVEGRCLRGMRAFVEHIRNQVVDRAGEGA